MKVSANAADVQVGRMLQAVNEGGAIVASTARAWELGELLGEGRASCSTY